MSLSYKISEFLWGKPSPPPESISGLGGTLKKDLKEYWIKPVDKVMGEPGKAIVYSTVIKIVSLLIALVFPFLGYATIGISIALIDRVAILNLGEFSKRFFESLSLDSIQNFFKIIAGSAPVTSKK